MSRRSGNRHMKWVVYRDVCKGKYSQTLTALGLTSEPEPVLEREWFKAYGTIDTVPAPDGPFASVRWVDMMGQAYEFTDDALAIAVALAYDACVLRLS